MIGLHKLSDLTKSWFVSFLGTRDYNSFPPHSLVKALYNDMYNTVQMTTLELSA